MSDQVIIGRQAFEDQKERMVEEFGVPEEEAEKYFNNVKTHVMLQAQEMDKGWSDETVNAITNLVFAIQQQQHQMGHHAKARFYNRVFRFGVSMLQAALFSVGIFLLMSDQLIPGGILFALGLASVFAATYNDG